MNIDRIIAHLSLVPHPEGGYFRETYRDPLPSGQRSHSTAIYFLLPGGLPTRWHRIDSAEVFHFYGGAPLALSTRSALDDPTSELTRVLGGDLSAGHEPQLIVLPSSWQRAQSTGAYSLVGCTVSPGFEFEHFEIQDIPE